MTTDIDKAVNSFLASKIARLYLAEGYYAIEPILMKEVISTLRHAEVFIRSREKMHPTGQKLYRELLEKLESQWIFFEDQKDGK